MANTILICIRINAIANQLSLRKYIYLRAIIPTGIFLLSFFWANAQTNGWYTAKQIGVKTWVINEPGINDNMYLVEGAE